MNDLVVGSITICRVVEVSVSVIVRVDLLAKKKVASPTEISKKQSTKIAISADRDTNIDNSLAQITSNLQFLMIFK